MKIESLADLKKLIQLCQKQGVKAIKVDNIELELSEDAAFKGIKTSSSGAVKGTSASQYPSYAPGGITEDVKIDAPDELTPEQLLMWSVDQSEAM